MNRYILQPVLPADGNHGGIGVAVDHIGNHGILQIAVYDNRPATVADDIGDGDVGKTTRLVFSVAIQITQQQNATCPESGRGGVDDSVDDHIIYSGPDRQQPDDKADPTFGIPGYIADDDIVNIPLPTEPVAVHHMGVAERTTGAVIRVGYGGQGDQYNGPLVKTTLEEIIVNTF